MPLIAKIINTNTTCLLFKFKPESRDALTHIDSNNVYMLAPLHSLPRNLHKIKVQLIGDSNVRINSPIYVDVVLWSVQNTFLDCGMGIVENPTVINENYNELSYINISPLFDDSFVNKPAKILFANKTGTVTSITTSIRDVNFTYGNSNNVFTLPHPGGFIVTNQPAIEGMSGSILLMENNLIGFIMASSDSIENSSLAMAVDMYYVCPHIMQCINVIDKYTNENSLAKLCEYTSMQSLIPQLTPVVNHLGADFTFVQVDKNNQEKYITLTKLHNYLDPLYLEFRQENTLSTFPLKTTLNSNENFLNYYYNKPEKSVIICKSAQYFDRVVKTEIDINFKDNSLFANILDYVFRGDSSRDLILNLQYKIRNSDSSITLSDVKPFTFKPVTVTDNFFNREQKRINTQIPEFFYYSNNSMGILFDSFGMKQKLSFLKMNKESQVKEINDSNSLRKNPHHSK